MPESFTLTELLDQIDDLVAASRTERDRAKSRRHLSDALRLTCRFLTRVRRKFQIFVQQALEDSPIDVKGTPLRLRDIAFTEPALELFRDRTTFTEFLVASGEVLRLRGMSENRLKELIHESQQLYENVLDENLTPEDLNERLAMLQFFFCRPPDDPDGPFRDPSGPGGSDETRGQKISRYIQTATALGSLIAQLLTGSGSSSPSAPSTPPPPPPSMPLRLLAVLLLAAFAGQLNADNEIPPIWKKKLQPELQPAGGATREEVSEEDEHDATYV